MFLTPDLTPRVMQHCGTAVRPDGREAFTYFGRNNDSILQKGLLAL
jgi:hypothetical protein